MVKHLFKHYGPMLNAVIAVISSESLSRLLVMIGMGISARHLDAVQYSQIAYGYSLFCSFWFLMELGVNIKASRRIPVAQNVFIERSKLISIRTLSAVFALIIAGKCFLSNENITGIFILALSARLLALDWFLRAIKKFWIAGLCQTLGGLVFFVAILLLVKSNGSVFQYGLSFCVSYFLISITTRLFSNCYYVGLPKFKNMMSELPSSMLIAGSGFLASAVPHVPIIIAKGKIDENGLASIGVLILVLTASMYAISMIAIAAMPFLAKFDRIERKKFIFSIICVGSICSISTAILIKTIHNILPYKYSMFVSALLGIFVLLYSVRRVYDTELMINRSESKYFKCLILSYIFIISAFLVLYKNFDALVAYSVSITIGEIALVALLFRESNFLGLFIKARQSF